MGYKLLGFVVWRVARWYVRQRWQKGKRRVIALGAIAALGVGGALVAQRAPRS
jgi:hypothetical protein